MSSVKDLDDGRRQALSDLRRLQSIILDNLQEGYRLKLMDAKELRLMGSTAIRSIRLFLKTINEEQARLAAKAADERAPSANEKEQGA
jgi:hypothetical protein